MERLVGLKESSGPEMIREPWFVLGLTVSGVSRHFSLDHAKLARPCAYHFSRLFYCAGAHVSPLIQSGSGTYLRLRLSKFGEPTTALRSAVCILADTFIVPQACQRAGPAEFWQSFGLEGVSWRKTQPAVSHCPHNERESRHFF
jgi:hypothetical protein